MMVRWSFSRFVAHIKAKYLTEINIVWRVFTHSFQKYTDNKSNLIRLLSNVQKAMSRGCACSVGSL